MEKLSFRVAEYEGPLDLILYLISKHKLDIYDIEISTLLEQYMEYMRQLELADLEISSEFLEMASRLVYMKTVSLLPRHEEEESALKRELTGQLLEYQACRRMAEKLKEKNISDRIFVRESMPIPADHTYQLVHDSKILAQTYILLLGKGRRKLPVQQKYFSNYVAKRIVSVNSKIFYLLRRFYQEHSLGFRNIFRKGDDRSDMVATFLALLELIKVKRIRVEEGDILILNSKKMPRSSSVPVTR